MTTLLAVIAALAAFWGFVAHKNKVSAEALVAEENEKDKLLEELNKELAANQAELAKEESNRDSLSKQKESDASIKDLVDFLNSNKSK